MNNITRYAYHTDHEHDARQHAVDAGWDHASYVDAYGVDTETEMPARYADVADVWHEGYQEGKDDFEATQAEEAMYGHDWRGENA